MKRQNESLVSSRPFSFSFFYLFFLFRLTKRASSSYDSFDTANNTPLGAYPRPRPARGHVDHLSFPVPLPFRRSAPLRPDLSHPLGNNYQNKHLLRRTDVPPLSPPLTTAAFNYSAARRCRPRARPLIIILPIIRRAFLLFHCPRPLFSPLSLHAPSPPILQIPILTAPIVAVPSFGVLLGSIS